MKDFFQLLIVIMGGDLDVTYPEDSIVIRQNLSTFTGGKTIDVSGNVNEVVKAGSVVIDDSGLGILQACKAHTAAASSAAVLKVYKDHTMKVGDAVKGCTITSIDVSNADYDTLTCSGTFGAAIAVADVIVNDGDKAIGVVVTTKVIKDNDTVDVGVMYRGEVNQNLMLVDADVKTALSLINFTND